jgi:hypothetical protein
MNTMTTRRMLAVAALLLGPLSLIASTIVQWFLQPAGTDPTAVDAAAQFSTIWLALGLAAVFGPLVWLAGIPSAVGLVTGRGSGLTLVGGLLTGFGLVVGAAHLSLFFGYYAALAASDLAPQDVASAVAAADGEPLSNTLLICFLIAFSLGPILLTVGLRIARRVGVWVPIAALITAAASFFGGPIAGIVQVVALALTWAPIAIAVARSDESAMLPVTALGRRAVAG